MISSGWFLSLDKHKTLECSWRRILLGSEKVGVDLAAGKHAEQIILRCIFKRDVNELICRAEYFLPKLEVFMKSW